VLLSLSATWEKLSEIIYYRGKLACEGHAKNGSLFFCDYCDTVVVQSYVNLRMGTVSIARTYTVQDS
jgi:hypothetical protein